jgi:hypothetical protein
MASGGWWSWYPVVAQERSAEGRNVDAPIRFHLQVSRRNRALCGHRAKDLVATVDVDWDQTAAGRRCARCADVLLSLERKHRENELSEARGRLFEIEAVFRALNEMAAISAAVQDAEDLDQARSLLMQGTFGISEREADRILSLALCSQTREARSRLHAERQYLIETIDGLEGRS